MKYWRFLFIYSCFWVVGGLILAVFEHVNFIKESILIKLNIFVVFILIVDRLSAKTWPELNIVPRKKSFVIVTIVGGTIIYTFLRGLIPDNVIPDGLIAELILRYFYWLFVLHCIFLRFKE